MRGIIPAILILTQLAQGMALPHSHAEAGGAEPAEHADRPHFHLRGVHGHHEHHHHGPGHAHHHDAPAPLPAAPALPVDHDGDAIFTTDQLAPGGAVSAASASAFWQHFLAASLDVSAVSAPPPMVPPRSLSPPGAGQFGCPIYLQTLALLL